jgi:hypothetical protein
VIEEDRTRVRVVTATDIERYGRPDLALAAARTAAGRVIDSLTDIKRNL